MDKIVRESEYFVAWLLMWLGGLLGGFVLGAGVGGLVGLFLGLAGADLGLVQKVCGGLGFLMGVIASYVLFRWIVAARIVRRVESRVQARTGAPPELPPQP